ncbi:TolC family protein [Parasphingorhabdus sp.]|uniref:TolC family protein n=1 Tax=Parasphingorhabdus sp. TaxID=2709688 RepID=UPI003A8FCD5B
MNIRHSLPLALTAISVAAPVYAQPEQGLPDEAVVQGALENHPSVLAARARVEAAKAEAQALGVGSHEITVSGSYTRRDVDNEGRFNEFDATAMRPFRLPGKKRLDRQTGKFGIIAAENMAEDVKHQAATLLGSLWWEWVGAGEEARVDAQAVKNYEQTLSAIKRRVQLRDAAQLDADQAEATLGAAKLAAAQSNGRATLARARIASQFPSLPLPVEAPELPLPQIPEGGFLALRDLVIKRSHEIAAANAQADRAGSVAERTRRDRFADPSFGFRVFSERDGMEKGAGVIASIPLGGRHRRALSDRASSEALAMQAEAAAVRFDVQEMADTDFAAAESGWQAWKRSREGMKAQVGGVMKMRRGYELGAFDLADLLLTERMAHDAFRTEVKARTEALRAITKLRIDSHSLWIGDDERDEEMAK